ncbi:MAG: flagellar basal body P-ring protein FlgI, partial [Planctomycetota bacterium]
LLSGYGLVVNLNGTGGGIIPTDIASSMERQMQLNGIGQGADFDQGPLVDPSTGRPLTASALLQSEDVAVVLVQAVIPRGSPRGRNFDVFVNAINATSLEGGLLWTTPLNLGPPSTFGGPQTQIIGEAYGPIFINPFAEPGLDPSQDSGALFRSSGRILEGGTITAPLAAQLAMDTPSHARVQRLEQSIRSRFPETRFDEGPAARGVDDVTINLLIPTEYRENPEEFLSLVEHLQVDNRFAPEYGRRYVAALREDPRLAGRVSWLLRSLGDPGIPFARELYNERDGRLRLAGLRAGAKLGDPLVEDGLLAFATNPRSRERLEAIRLLGEADTGPQTDAALRELAASGELVVRTAAYESLAQRSEIAHTNRLISASSSLGAGAALNRREAELRASLAFPADPVRGVSRRLVAGKFVLDVVPFGDPMIYVVQQGRPRIVIFGEDARIAKPTVIDTWSDRFMMIADRADDPIRLLYRDYRTGQMALDPDAPDGLAELADYLARRSAPEFDAPGLDLSYSETVGVLHAIAEAQGSRLAFATEEDRLIAAVTSFGTDAGNRRRPEIDAASEPPPDLPTNPREPRRPRVVPLNTPPAAAR